MWLGTEDDVCELWEKVQNFSLPSSCKQDKDDIYSETVIRVLTWTKNTTFEELYWGAVVNRALTYFRFVVIENLRGDKYREMRISDHKIQNENDKIPNVEYLQPTQDSKATIKDFYLSSYKNEETATLEKIKAYEAVKAVIDQKLQQTPDAMLAEFMFLCLWNSDQGYSLMELARQAQFTGKPVLERAIFISDIQVILEKNYKKLALKLKYPKTIKIHRESIDASGSEGTGDVQFSILPDRQPSIERNVYLFQVYKILKTTFDKEHEKIDDPDMANLIYLGFWSVNLGLTFKELAESYDIKADKAVTYRSRFIAKIVKRLREQNMDLFIKTTDSEIEASSSYDFTSAELNKLFSPELASQVNDNE